MEHFSKFLKDEDEPEMSSENENGETKVCRPQQTEGKERMCHRARRVLDVKRRVTWVILQSNTCFVFQKHFSYGKCKSIVCSEKFWRTKINVNGSKWRIFYSSQGNVF